MHGSARGGRRLSVSSPGPGWTPECAEHSLAACLRSVALGPMDLPQHFVSVLQHTATPDRFHGEGPLTHHPRPGTSVSLWGLMMPPLATHQCFYIFLMHFKANCKHLHPSL